MGEWHEIPELWKQRWADPLVWLATFALTILADLTVAVEVGHDPRGAAVHQPRRVDDDRHAG